MINLSYYSSNCDMTLQITLKKLIPFSLLDNSKRQLKTPFAIIAWADPGVGQGGR